MPIPIQDRSPFDLPRIIQDELAYDAPELAIIAYQCEFTEPGPVECI